MTKYGSIRGDRAGVKCKLQKKLLIVLFTLGTLLLKPQLVSAEGWRPVRGSKAYGISGIALVSQQQNFSSFLVVHDNKLPDQGRVALLNVRGEKQPEYIPLEWPARVEMPFDLEGLTAVPGIGQATFMAATSSGRIYHLQLDRNNSLSVLKIFDLPNIPAGSNLESFALQDIDGQLLAVYAHRGAGAEPGVIYWGVLDLAAYQLSGRGSVALEVPWPGGNVRHVSDLKVDTAGVVFVSSASDTEDNGPFQSAIYVVGAFQIGDRQIQFRQNLSLTSLYRFDFRKIEALELLPGEVGGVIVGTDDENMGSSVFLSW